MKKQFILEISEYGKVIRKMEDSNHERFMKEVERIMLDHLRNYCHQTGEKRENEVKNTQFHIYNIPMNERKVGFDKTGAIMCQGDWVEVDAPKEGDTHKTEFKGMVQIIDQDKKRAIIMDMDGDSFWVDWDGLECVAN